MGAKKSLKKLKKKVEKKVQSKSMQQLGALASSTQNSNRPQQNSSSQWQAEFKQVSQQALVNVASELAAPLNPLLSWFNDGNVIPMPQMGRATSSTNGEIKKSAELRPNIKSIVHLPLKSPPCKRCPALSNGVCKCAAKKLQMSA